MRSTNKNYHPGEGRGPVATSAVTKRSASLHLFPNWAPAFAGVAMLSVERTYPFARSHISASPWIVRSGST